MSKPKLGFKIWFRNFKDRCKSGFLFFLKSRAASYFGGVLTILGIWFAYTANELAKKANKFSETALELAKNDSSQQIQINKLTNILIEVKAQNDISKNQTKELINLVSEANKINFTTNNLIADSKRQTELLLQQFQLSKRTDSLSKVETSVATESDLLLLRKIFEEIREVSMIRKIMSLYLDQTPDINTIIDLRNKFEKALSNKIFLMDPIIKPIWYSYYQELKVVEDNVKIFNAQEKPKDKLPKIKDLVKNVRDHYITNVNLIWQRLDTLENNFRRNTFK